MPSLWFVTPAWQRFELTRICLEQRRQVCDELLERFGLEATCVVVADDENLNLAEEFGFETVERDNQWLGQKFNDGYEAAALAGADYVYAIGSDSWIDPDYFAELPGLGEVRMSRFVSIVRSDGRERMDLDVVYPSGGYGAAAIVPVQLFAARGYRPCKERISSGMEASAWRRSFGRSAERLWPDGRARELVNFQSETQVTPYRALRKWAIEIDQADPLGALRPIYGDELVARIEAFYAARQIQTGVFA